MNTPSRPPAAPTVPTSGGAAPAAGPDDPPPAAPGITRSVTEGHVQPRLPHERDESADSQAAAAGQPDATGRQALQDLQRGVMDTDRGPLLDRLYQRLFRRPRRGR